MRIRKEIVILIKILDNGVMYIHDFKCATEPAEKPRKKGSGKMLLKKVIRHLHDKKFITFVIGMAQSPEDMDGGDNEKLLDYYKRLGFRVFDEDNSYGLKDINYIYNFSDSLLTTIGGGKKRKKTKKKKKTRKKKKRSTKKKRR
jgi:hypothetical protein